MQYVKCGFANENFPTSVFPCVVGRPMLRYEESLMEQYIKDVVVGDACLKLRHQLDISYPVNNGIVQNWDDMGHVWDHAFFNELKVDPTECKILLTDPPLNPSKNREKMSYACAYFSSILSLELDNCCCFENCMSMLSRA
nr:actin-related protein 2 [Ipomoea batatas]